MSLKVHFHLGIILKLEVIQRIIKSVVEIIIFYYINMDAKSKRDLIWEEKKR